jgi:uncharacterized delta-60 repeat protein
MKLVKQASRRNRPILEALECRTLLNAGDLDLSFGGAGTGTANTSFGGSVANATSVVVQPWDSKSVVAGFDHDNGYKFALARYNSDGTLDPSFGSGGKVSMLLGKKGNTSNGFIKQILLTPDRKILAVGYSDNGRQSIALARYNSNGTLDTTFGSGGEVLTAMAGKNGNAQALVAALDPSGRIVVGGKGNGNPILVRYTSNGSLDTTFGNKGMVLGTSGSNVYDVWQALQIQPVGTSYQIVAAGFDGSNGHGAIARFNANGTPVSAFGTKGEVAVNLPGGGTTVPMVFQPDGKLVAVYETGLSDDAIVLSRFNVNGTPDGGFGTGGQVVTDASSIYNGSQASASPSAVGIDPDGRIVVAGQAQLSNSWLNSLVIRYDSTGSLDSSFGNNGSVATLVGGTTGGEEERYQALAFQPDGNIITAGYVTTGYDPSTGNFTSIAMDVSRYFSDAPTTLATTSAMSSLAATSPMSTSSSTPDSFLSPLALDSLLFEDPLTPVSKHSSRPAAG